MVAIAQLLTFSIEVADKTSRQTSHLAVTSGLAALASPCVGFLSESPATPDSADPHEQPPDPTSDARYMQDYLLQLCI